MIDDTFDDRLVEVRKFAHKKRSNLMRSIYRSSRARSDAEIMKAWLMRAIRRTSNVYAVDDPEWRYEMDPVGTGATQIAYVRVLEARDDFERALFAGLRIQPHLHNFRYMVPRSTHVLTPKEPDLRT